MHMCECGQICTISHIWGWSNMWISGMELRSVHSPCVLCIFSIDILCVISETLLQAGCTKPRHTMIPCARHVLKQATKEERKGACLEDCKHSFRPELLKTLFFDQR